MKNKNRFISVLQKNNRHEIANYVRKVGEVKFVAEIERILQDDKAVESVAKDETMRENFLFSINMALLMFMNRRAKVAIERSGGNKLPRDEKVKKLVEFDLINKLKEKNIYHEVASD